MRRLALFLVVLFCFLAPARAQKTVTPRWPFAQGEELVYQGELSKLLLRGVNVAELKFVVVEGPKPGAQTAHAEPPATFRFVADAESKGALLKLFKQYFRQHLESTVEITTLAALETKKEDIQNKRERISQTVFDYRAGKLTWTERNPRDAAAPPRVVTAPLSGTPQDLVSVWYYLRTLKSFTPGTTFELPVSDSGRIYRIPVRVGERKTMKTLLGKVPVVRLDPEIFGADRLLSGDGKLTIWLTDDARRIPVKGELSSNLGKLSITLKRAKL